MICSYCNKLFPSLYLDYSCPNRSSTTIEHHKNHSSPNIFNSPFGKFVKTDNDDYPRTNTIDDIMTDPSQKRKKSVVSLSQPSSLTRCKICTSLKNVRKNLFNSQPSNLTKGIKYNTHILVLYMFIFVNIFQSR